MTAAAQPQRLGLGPCHHGGQVLGLPRAPYLCRPVAGEVAERDPAPQPHGVLQRRTALFRGPGGFPGRGRLPGIGTGRPGRAAAPGGSRRSGARRWPVAGRRAPARPPAQLPSAGGPRRVMRRAAAVATMVPEGGTMLRNLLVYGLMVAMLVVVAWLFGRLLGVPPARRPNGAILANPWADAECAFDQALAEHKRRRYAALLVGRAGRLRLPRLDEAQGSTAVRSASRASPCGMSSAPSDGTARPSTAISGRRVSGRATDSSGCSSP